jgi:hypothetical protein
MSEERSGDAEKTGNVTSNERREALIKLGRYAAYATPIVVASMSSALGGAPPISGAPSSPPPAPAPV